MEKITIATAKPYDILIESGILRRAGELMREVIEPCKICVVTDSNVADLYATELLISLSDAGYDPCVFRFEAGEASKTTSTVTDLVEYMGRKELTRSDAVVALGGGVTGDIAGFAASVYMRGIRYVQTLEQLNRNVTWACRVIARQGGIMLEPYYNKVSDFAMEYEATANGDVVYRGLSLFRTQNGAYTGSIVATEEAKEQMLSRYVTSGQLEAVRQTVADILAPVLRGVYAGPFGIDMMVVAREGVSGFLLHPCIELNLRRTMGHVALSLPCDATMPQRLMRISYSGNYRLQVMNTNENVLDGFLLR